MGRAWARRTGGRQPGDSARDSVPVSTRRTPRVAEGRSVQEGLVGDEAYLSCARWSGGGFDVRLDSHFLTRE